MMNIKNQGKLKEEKFKDMKWYRMGKGEPILFLHGFGIDPKEYELIEKLAENNEVIAPRTAGFTKDRKINDIASRIDELLKEEIKTDNLSEVYSHSIGGSTGALLLNDDFYTKDNVMVSPVEKVDYNGHELLRRGLTDFMKGKYKNHGVSYALGFLKNLQNNFALAQDTTDFDYEGIELKGKGIGTTIITTEKDGLFDHKYIDELKEKVDLKGYENISGCHNEILKNPDKIINTAEKYQK
ncbi:MAG: alpha/beta fold hydrolase [Nanobdellota archaeon]